MALDANNKFSETVHKTQCGSLKVPTADEVVHGHSYQSQNRRVFQQPNAKEDMIYDDGNFISRLDNADRKRAVGHSNVLPLSAEE